MIIIGVDPAVSKPQAYSIWRDGKLINYGKFIDVQSWHRLLIMYDDIYNIYIEDQYLGVNYKTSKKLSVQVGKLIGIAEFCRHQYEIVNASTWQSRLRLLEGLKNLKGSERKKFKKNRLIKTAQEIDASIDDEDIAAAVLIVYATKEYKYEV